MLNTVQAARGIAALSVTAFHLSIGLGDERYLGHKVFDTFTWRLNLGVDFFFVLSGFIILMSHIGDIDRPNRLYNFAQKRFIRIYPIYWVYLSVFLVLVALGVGRMQQLPDGILQWLTAYSLIRFASFQNPIAPAWTLFHEIVFYAAFAILILNRRIGLVVFSCWAAACAFAALFMSFADFTLGSVVLSLMNIDFGIGMLAFLLMRKLGSGRSGLTLLGGCILLAATYMLNLTFPENRLFALPYGIAFGLILSSIAVLEMEKGFKVPAIMVFLGDASYSIYLVHEAFEGLFMKIFIRLDGILALGDGTIYFGVLFCSVATGCIAHLAVERPLLATIRKYIKRNEPGARSAASQPVI